METHSLKRVRLSNSNNTDIDFKYLYQIPDWENLREYDERIILNKYNYKIIFGKENPDGFIPAKRGIVKITSGDNTIYRLFYAKPINVDTTGLTQLSMKQIRIQEGQHILNLETANTFWGKFMFYYDHPFHEVRVPIKIAFLFGIISVLLGLLSIGLGIIALK